MKRTKTVLAAAGVLLAAALHPSTASACGGFFCNSAQPVNQAAEQIIFADDGGGKVTAVIQIMYQGPSQNFSWLLPIAGVPKEGDIGVASNLAFQRLQAATNPQYTLTTKVEGTCKQDGTGGFAAGPPSVSGTGGTGGTTAVGMDNGGGVKVEASGVIGNYEWTVISLDQSLASPADAAVNWLQDHGYDVPPSAPPLLGPYLEDGLNLLALRLTKGSDTGSIRPIVLTYDSKKPMIPIKLTAVAANENMGVLAWLLSDSRAVPQNYLSLELNDALINWFSPGATYGAVVSAAADDAGGQGFVTEFSGSTDTLKNVAWSTYEEQRWQQLQSSLYSSFDDMFMAAYNTYQGYDGFWDAVQASVTLPDTVKFADFKLCPNCYSGSVQLTPSDFFAALQKDVVDPMKVVNDIIAAHPKLTRLYTTMSADEMTLDPLFTFNADLADVSNVHTADRVIECSADVYQFDAPWRIELPQGGVVRGVGQPPSTWPINATTTPDMPPNYRITQQGDTGKGNLIEDNSDAINAGLKAYNASLPTPPKSSGGTSGVGTGGSSGSGATGGTTGGTTSASGGMAAGGVPATGSSSGDGNGGCALNPRGMGSGWALVTIGLVALGRRKRLRVS